MILNGIMTIIVCIISPNSVAFEADRVKVVVEDTRSGISSADEFLFSVHKTTHEKLVLQRRAFAHSKRSHKRSCSSS